MADFSGAYKYTAPKPPKGFPSGRPPGAKGPTPKPPKSNPNPNRAAKGGGGGGGGKGRGGRGGKGMTLQQMAAQEVKLSERPILQQIAQERAANLARAQEQMGFAKAAAALMQQAAPNVQQGYTNAANADAGYAKGLGNLAQGQLDQNAASNNAFLEKMGTPSGALQAAPPVGTLAFGTHGYIPATGLQREGAAWGAAAQLAPGHLLARGQQDMASTLANDTNLRALQAELAKIAATQPEVYRQLVAQVQAQQARMQALQQGQQRINISQYNAQTSRMNAQESHAYHQQSLEMQRERITLSRAKDNTAVANAIIQGKRIDSAASHVAGYLIDRNGDAILNHGKKIPVRTAAKGKKGGLIFPPTKKTNPNGAGFGAGIEPSAYHTLSKAGKTVINLAHEYLGTPYVWGGESPKGFDCSGFAQFLYGKAGINIPRTTYTQWDAPNGRKVGKRQLMPGDLVFYKGSDSITSNGRVLPGHVGIYIGHGKIIDAYGTGYGVRIDSVFSPALGGFMGGRRYK